MIIGLLGLVVIVVGVVAVVAAVRKASSHDRAAPGDGHAIRRFFQYLVLFGLLVVTANGLTGLLGRAFGAEAFLVDDADLALSLAFTVVGLPLFTGVALWSRRNLKRDPAEAQSFGWAAYVTLAALLSLTMAADALSATVQGWLGARPNGAEALAALVVWGAIWGAHWWIHLRLVPAPHSRVHHLGGSLVGLITAVTGLVVLAGAVLQQLVGMGSQIVPSLRDQLISGAVGLVVGALVWALYWLRTASREERSPLWFGYVLLVGGAGLVMAIVAASTVLYTTLVWLIGDPEFTDALRHFVDAPTAAAVALVGVAVWWYHQSVLGQSPVTARTEVRRVYEYLMSAIGLLAAGVGLTLLVVAGIEAAVGSEVVVIGSSAVNTLLLAGTLLVVGAPVWWFFWHRIQRCVAADPAAELASPTRRIYLLLLFGLGGVAAVVSLLVGVYLLFQDLVQGTFGPETIRAMRIPIGILLSTGAIAGYHGAVYRSGRELVPHAGAHGPRYVLLVGPADPEIAHAVAHETGGRVQAWTTETGGEAWSIEDVMTAIGTSPEASEVLVLSDPSGVHAIPVSRS
ncbi:DUF5671 domain-containing protein [Humibacillus xanthopallidus]|uniref:DUF5671 domain-containing protein n=1 Tax=Humibacillus xanthopallidus TaxID=412689 RepID=A0A543HIB2_9MICO|nr:DUF5671 domain-containing protein [Humibacillus xanthopallidus]TQM58062.1 hypothetical protein FBY41_3419 [Humibacillus xanthopallidus]